MEEVEGASVRSEIPSGLEVVRGSGLGIGGLSMTAIESKYRQEERNTQGKIGMTETGSLAEQQGNHTQSVPSLVHLQLLDLLLLLLAQGSDTVQGDSHMVLETLILIRADDLRQTTLN